MIKYRVFYGLILFSLFLFYIFCESYVPLLIIIVVIALTILSVIAAAFAARNASAEISASHPVITKGESSEAQFGIKITNNFFLPLSDVTFRVEFEDMQESDGTQRKLSTTMCARETRTIYAMAATEHCAYIRCAVTDMHICDAFGLTAWRVKKGLLSSHMTIMPVMSQRSFMEILPAVNTDDSDRYADYKKGGDPSQVFEIREYSDGDDMRRVHWGLSSKYDELMVKEFSQPISDSCMIVIETGIKNDTPENRKLTSDRLMSVFLKLADELIQNEQMFSVCWFSHQGEKNVLFDVVIHDDVFPVVEGFLSMKFSDDLCETLVNTKAFLESTDKRIYYIFSSGSFNKEMLNDLSEKYIPIDADVIFDENGNTEIGELFETKR